MAEYIDREELLRIEKFLDTEVLRASKTASTIYDQMMYDIEHVPAADVAPVKHGKWEPSIYANDFWRCSNCSSVWNRRFEYCPHCGSKMDLEE